MSISRTDAPQTDLARTVRFTNERLIIELTDGREIAVPLTWYPRLEHATPNERANWELIGRGDGMHWPHLDEDVSVEGILAGRPSGESSASFDRWLALRA